MLTTYLCRPSYQWGCSNSEEFYQGRFDQNQPGRRAGVFFLGFGGWFPWLPISVKGIDVISSWHYVFVVLWGPKVNYVMSHGHVGKPQEHLQFLGYPIQLAGFSLACVYHRHNNKRGVPNVRCPQSFALRLHLRTLRMTMAALSSGFSSWLLLGWILSL